MLHWICHWICHWSSPRATQPQGVPTRSTLLSAVAISGLVLGIIVITPLKKSYAKSVDLRGTTQLEADFFTDVKNRKMSKWSISDAFFIASGIRTPRDLDKARAWLKGKVQKARADLSKYRGVQKKADYLLRWIHSQMFSRYRASATDALAMIRSGHFNCLSSCIIYGIIAKELGIKVKGVAVDKHAFCRVYRGRKGWDVETTTPVGFNPGRKVKLDQAVVSVPRNQYRNRRELTLFEMIGLIYTNHMGLSRAFPTMQDQLLAYQKALLFFPKKRKILHNLIALHTQIISDEIQRKNWQSAFLYIEQLKGYDRKGKYWPEAKLNLIDKMVAGWARSGEVSQAIEFLKQRTLDSPELSVPAGYMLGSLLAQSAQGWIQAKKFAQGRALFFQAMDAPKQAQKWGKSKRHRSKLRLSRSALKVYRHNYFAGLNNTIIMALKHRNSALAKELVQAGIKRHPKERARFQDLLRSVQDMEAEDEQRAIYRESAELANQQRWTQALRRITSGLRRYPRSRHLRELKEKIEPIKLATEIVELIKANKLTKARRRLRSAQSQYPRHDALMQVQRMLD